MGAMAGTEQGRGRRALMRRRPAAAVPPAAQKATLDADSDATDLPYFPVRPGFSDLTDLPDLPDWADLPHLPLPRPAIDEPLPAPEHPDQAFVCSVCRREIQLSERSRIAPSKCRACV